MGGDIVVKHVTMARLKLVVYGLPQPASRTYLFVHSSLLLGVILYASIHH